MSAAFYHRQRNALQHIPDRLKQIAVYSLPFVSYSLTGVENLRDLFKHYSVSSKMVKLEHENVSLPSLNEMINDFSSNGTQLIFTMEKAE
ncbi:hypothetical protein J2Y73_005176 [Peribacillus frigoritolerans]|uniref:hypothetical protein n=1 Tax=Peribacillus frigoritolerans TaxID=450367 RepID=UPI00281566F7|nr:hypothetical protein [Peribacillus frigoritolerans]MCP1495145.1 hypothetical protein [Peribacillus frigoritolerans]